MTIDNDPFGETNVSGEEVGGGPILIKAQPNQDRGIPSGLTTWAHSRTFRAKILTNIEVLTPGQHSIKVSGFPNPSCSEDQTSGLTLNHWYGAGIILIYTRVGNITPGKIWHFDGSDFGFCEAIIGDIEGQAADTTYQHADFLNLKEINIPIHNYEPLPLETVPARLGVFASGATGLWSEGATTATGWYNK